MTVLSGKEGRVLIGTTPIADVVRWSFRTIDRGVSYASSATGPTKRRLAGAQGGSGTITFKLNAAAPVTQQLAAGQAVTLLLHLEGERHFAVPAVLDALELAVDVDRGDLIGGTAEFTADGSWTAPSF